MEGSVFSQEDPLLIFFILPKTFVLAADHDFHNTLILPAVSRWNPPATRVLVFIFPGLLSMEYVLIDRTTPAS